MWAYDQRTFRYLREHRGFQGTAVMSGLFLVCVFPRWKLFAPPHATETPKQQHAQPSTHLRILIGEAKGGVKFNKNIRFSRHD